MLAKIRSSLWLVIFIMLPNAIASRSSIPTTLMIISLLAFIVFWVVRVKSATQLDADAERKAMGIDKIGIIILAVMGAAFALLKLAIIYGGQAGYMIFFAGLLIAMILALLIASIASVCRVKTPAASDHQIAD